MSTLPARILVADDVAPVCGEILRAAGFEVDERGRLTEDELARAVAPCHGLVVRSGVRVSAGVIANAPNLRAVARAGIGVDNIDVEAATRRGIAVFNSPEGNVVAAAEHTLALIFAVARNIPQAHAALRKGRWERTRWTGTEIHGKTLGILGLGKVGSCLAAMVRGLQMTVIAHDPYITPERAGALGVEWVAFDELLARADILTVHVPLTDETRGLIGRHALRRMKRGARIVNTARGGIVDEAALAEALESGHIAAAALDVFETEPPPPGHPLLHHERVIVTPHLGASTEEAQVRVAEDVARQIVEYFTTGTVRRAVNLAGLADERLRPFLRLAQDLGALAAQLLDGPLAEIEVCFRGEFEAADMSAILPYAVRGALIRALGDEVNAINAILLARERGIRITDRRTEAQEPFRRILGVAARGPRSERTAEGTLVEGREARILRIDRFRVDVRPAKHMLAMFYPDRPGMVGKFGTILGRRGINIARMEVGRIERGGQALMLLSVDDPVPAEVLDEIRAEIEHHEVRAVTLP